MRPSVPPIWRRECAGDAELRPFREWFPLTLGMAEYRSGPFAEADKVLVAAIAGGKGNAHITGTAAFYGAMSLFRQGKPDEPRQFAYAAAAKMKPLPKDEMNPLTLRGDEAAGEDDSGRPGSVLRLEAVNRLIELSTGDEQSSQGPLPRFTANSRCHSLSS